MNRRKYRKRNLWRSILAGFLAVMLMIGLCPISALAEEDPDYQGIQVAELPGTSIHFVYNDAWFDKSSSVYDQHLATLSMLMSERSGDKGSATAFLEAMGYTDVKSNAYYGMSDDRPNSVGFLVGQKKLTTEEGEVTLLALVVNGAHYNLQWDGDFYIGDLSEHKGFTEARDEALRFLKKYIGDTGISGRVKIWAGGHSRGAAIANLLGAYLADPSFTYLTGIETDPEDVYVYTFATPANMVEGELTRREFGRVEGNRSAVGYENDTPGEAYSYEGDGGDVILDPQDDIYRGIHNTRPAEDLITGLPMKAWNYTCFGFDGSGIDYSTQKEMLTWLNRLDPKLKEGYEGYGGPDNYRWKTFDLNGLAIIDDTTIPEPIDQAKFFRSRLDGMAKAVGTKENYVAEGFENGTTAVAGMVGSLTGDLVNALTEDKLHLIATGVFTYISYVKQWHKTEKNVDLTDGEAGAMVLRTVLEMVTGETIAPEELTADNVLYLAAKYIIDNTKPIYGDPANPTEITGYTHSTKLAETLFNSLTQQMTSNPDMAFLGSAVYPTLCGIVYGESEKTQTPPTRESGKAWRENFYALIPMILADQPDIIATIGTDGSCNMKDLIPKALPLLYPKKNMKGEDVTCKSVDEAADVLIGNLFSSAIQKLTASGKVPKDGPVAEIYKDYVNRIAENAGDIRKLVTGFLLTVPGDDFDIPAQIRSAVTLIGQANAILYSHLPGIYAAWFLAADDLYPYVVSSLAEGDYEEGISLTLTAEDNTRVYYTLDGSDPTEQSMLYDGQLVFPQTEEKQEIRIRAAAIDAGQIGRIWEYDYTVEAPVTYSIVSGAGGEWTQDSEDSLRFTAKRSCNDDRTYGCFRGIDVDGNAVEESAYEKEKGSLILTLPADYLKTLSVGEHTLTLVFEDVLTAETTFTILEKQEPEPQTEEPSTEEPEPSTEKTEPSTEKPDKKPGSQVKTGDDTPIILISVLLGVSLLGVGIVIVLKRKNKKDD